MKKKVFGFFVLVTIVCFSLVGCDSVSENEKEATYTEEIKSQISMSIGKPNVSNFFEYAQLKEIYEMRDNPNLICYWYTKNDMTGKWVYQGECIGYGIPYGASITNPEQLDGSYKYGYVSIPLAEPNGLYTNGVTSSATWVLTADETGEVKPTYVESEITVTQTKMDKKLCEEWSIPENY